MIEVIILVFDLDIGNSGKGGVIHKLAGTVDAGVVLKFGGGQTSYGVIDNKGKRFNFSHWGCATLTGTPTYIMPNFVAIPRTMVDEAKNLQYLGVEDPYKLLKVDPSVLCVTCFHQIAEQLLELSEQDRPSSSWASGVEEAHRLSEEQGEDFSLRFGDLSDDIVLEKKLTKIMMYYQEQFIDYDTGSMSEEDRERALNLLHDLHQDCELVYRSFLQIVDIICNSSLELKSAKAALQDYDGTAIGECSQGVLADAKRGLQPRAGALRALPKFVKQTLREAGFTGKISQLGVTKACVLRHGGITSPTATAEPPADLSLSDINSDLATIDTDEAAFRERWKEKVQYGPLDLVLLQQAIDLCGGAQEFDGLCVTWLDQVLKDGVFQYCDRYLQPYHVSENGDPLEGEPNEVLPLISSYYDLQHTTVGSDSFNQAICDFFQTKLHIPVTMLSFGARDNDKIILET